MNSARDMTRGIGGKLAALLAAMLLAVLLADYPFQPLLAAGLVAAYCALLYWRPQWWLVLVPAALPWLDLSPWSGRLYIDELDLMLLATLAIGYWRLSMTPPDSRLSAAATVLFALLALVTAVAAWRGLQPLTAPDLNSYANYLSPYNSLRVAKGTLWALLLLPLLRRAGGAEGIARRLVPGMLLGLLLTGMAVTAERALFPGLLNFSADYRPTAPFAAMHTGGAALDAYLAMSFPFAAWWLLWPERTWQTAAALLLLLLGLFTGLTLFSRDVWLAYGAAAAILVVPQVGAQLAAGRLHPAGVAAVMLVMALLGAALAMAFASGGYRTLGVLLALWGAVLLLGGLPRPTAMPRLSASVAVLFSLSAAAAVLLFRSDGLPGWLKGPYFAFLLTAGGGVSAAFAAAIGPVRLRAKAAAVALGAFLPLTGCAILVAWHWGGAQAARAAAPAALLAVVVMLLCALRRRPLWTLNRASISVGCAAAAVLAVVIPVLSSAYMEQRMSTVASDWQRRLNHWNEAIDMMPDRWDTRLLGAGLGRYPASYPWHNRVGEQPGSYRYQTEAAGNRFLQLAPPQHSRGYADPLRHLQVLSLQPRTPYLLAFDLRRPAGQTHLLVALCRRWLLYPQDCVTPATLSNMPRDGWRHYELMFDSSHLHGLTRLELAAHGPAGAIDIDNISIRGPDGVERVRNGSFVDGQDGWFFSSDRNHLPWHIKNLYVHTYFEQGWMGLVALALLVAYALWRLAARGWAGKPGASVYLAALSGALVVGVFDSVFDVPRLTLLFFLLLSASLLATTATAHRAAGSAPGRSSA